MDQVRPEDRISDPEELTESIAAALIGPAGAYVELVDPNEPGSAERIALVRSTGRKAGRRAGVRVATVVSDELGVLRLGGMAIALDRGDHLREVHVVKTSR